MLYSLVSINLVSLVLGTINYGEYDYGKCKEVANCKLSRQESISKDLGTLIKRFNKEPYFCYCDSGTTNLCADYRISCDKSYDFNQCAADHCEQFDGQERKACRNTFCKSKKAMARDKRHLIAGTGVGSPFLTEENEARTKCEVTFCGGLQSEEFTKCQAGYCDFSINPIFVGTQEVTIINNRLQCMFASYAQARVQCNDVNQDGSPQSNDDLQKSRGVDKKFRKFATTLLGREIKANCVDDLENGISQELSECWDMYKGTEYWLGRSHGSRIKNKQRGHCKMMLYEYFYKCLNDNYNTRQCQNYRKNDDIKEVEEQYSSCAPARQNTCYEKNLVSDEEWDNALACTEDDDLNNEQDDACMCPKGYYRQNHFQNGRCVHPDSCRLSPYLEN
jgi:hypothetical protein